MSKIGLAAAIEELRQELYKAQEAGVRQQFAFEVEEAQLELLLELRSDVRPEGKLSFGVASVGVGGTSASARTHKLVLKLKVRDQALGEGPDGPRNALVNDSVSKDW
ncbi:trypco2 family protein [Streptomyces sp. NPDC001135]